LIFVNVFPHTLTGRPYFSPDAIGLIYSPSDAAEKCFTTLSQSACGSRWTHELGALSVA
jgi:hypothetical protein